MHLDALSVVVGFLAAVESVLGAAAAVLGIRGARGPGGAPEERRRPLLVLVAGALLGVGLVSCPLLYLLLASWVPRWPGIMCIEGVRRIGTGSAGPAGWLPGLVAALDGTKLLLVFAAGAWAVLRRVPGEAASRRAALAAAVLGLVAVLDGGAAFAYVAIPKEEVPAEAGCCTIARRGARREAGLTAEGDAGGGASPALAAGFVAGAAILGAGALALRRGPAAGRPSAAALALLAALAAASLLPAARFLSGIAAPAVLGLPHHRCAWCAFARAPETIVGAALHAGAVLCSGWALVARLGSAEEAEAAGPGILRPLLGAAAFGFLGAAAMAAVLVLLP